MAIWIGDSLATSRPNSRGNIQRITMDLSRYFLLAFDTFEMVGYIIRVGHMTDFLHVTGSLIPLFLASQHNAIFHPIPPRLHPFSVTPRLL